jgi:hypothetical protein
MKPFNLVIPGGPPLAELASVQHEPSEWVPDLAKRIREAHSKAAEHARSAVTYAAEAGACLMRAKECSHHGQFEAWVAKYCGFSARTARAYMQIATRMQALPDADRQRVAELPLREALKAIAAPPVDPNATPKPPAPKWVRMRSKTDMERFNAELGDAAAKLRTVARNVGGNALQRKDYERARKALTHALELLDQLAAAEVTHAQAA